MAICSFVPDDLKVQSTFRAVTRAIGYLTDNSVCVMRENYRGGQPKLLWSGLALLRPIVTKVENQNLKT